MFAALRSLVTSDSAFPYEVGELLCTIPGAPWRLHQGKTKTDGSAVSVFAFELGSASPQDAAVARNAVKRLKTLRHPSVLRFLDTSENSTHIYMVTEPVIPLSRALEEDRNDQAISWGIYQIAKALDFLVKQKLVHRNLCLASVFVDKSGEWKLGGVGLMESEQHPSDQQLPSPQKKYLPPEWGKSAKSHPWSMDMWGLGCLMWEVYNGELPGPEKLKAIQAIPKSLVPHWAALVSAKPLSRPAPDQFIENARQQGNYLRNAFVDTNLFLEEITLKEKDDTINFFKSLPEVMDEFPKTFCVHKILPQLLNAFQFAGAGSQVLAPLLKIGKMLDAAEFQKTILPCVVKLFSSTDRATRISLLQQLDSYVAYLTEPVASNDIFPSVASGFSDSMPAMREQTLRSMLLLAPKLSQAVIDGQMLRHFAKLQMDEQPGIRTNTTVCLGKLAPTLSVATRKKVLIPAFLRALKDPFPHARSAGLMALSATEKYYPSVDCATKVLPAIVVLTVDAETTVREQALSTVRLFLKKIERYHKGEEEEMPGEPAAQESGSVAAAASSWAGWAGSAVSGLSSSLMKASAASNSSKPATSATPAASSAPPAHSTAAPATSSAKASAAGSAATHPAKQPSDNEDWSDYGDEWDDASSTLPPASSATKKAASGGGDDGWGAGDGWGEDDDDDLDLPAEDPSAPVAKVTPAKPAATQSGSVKSPKRGGMKLGGAKKSSTTKQSSLDDDGWGTPASTTAKAGTNNAAPNDGWGADDGGDGWGDDDDDDGWGESSSDPPAKSSGSSTPKQSSPPRTKPTATKKQTTAADDGWGDDGWGDESTTTSKAATPQSPSVSKDDRAAARAARMEAARERREALRKSSGAGSGSSSGSKKSGLGAVRKKD